MMRKGLLVGLVVVLFVSLGGLLGCEGQTPEVAGKIAFCSERDGNKEIYVMNADGSNQVRLTYNDASDYKPTWSPDGKKIAFTSNRNRAIDYGIYVMNADGSIPVRLTDGQSQNYVGDPAWSPDGKNIAFSSSTIDYGEKIYDPYLKTWITPWSGGDYEIYVMNADGSNQVRLTDNDAEDGFPTWSPDGKKIAFSSGDDIYVMNADGSNQVRLRSGLQPTWSPDGRKIAFTYVGEPHEICVMNADGSNLVILGGSGSQPAWSPDGKKIAFVSDGDIYVMNADGSNQVRLTITTAADMQPAWSPQ